MNEAAMQERIRELSDMVTASPLTEPKSRPDGSGLYESHVAGKQTAVSDSLDLLRLQLKYLLFDLEATRRENRYLRQMLESRGRRDREDGSDNDPKKWQTPPGL